MTVPSVCGLSLGGNYKGNKRLSVRFTTSELICTACKQKKNCSILLREDISLLQQQQQEMCMLILMQLYSSECLGFWDFQCFSKCFFCFCFYFVLLFFLFRRPNLVLPLWVCTWSERTPCGCSAGSPRGTWGTASRPSERSPRPDWTWASPRVSSAGTSWWTCSRWETRPLWSPAATGTGRGWCPPDTSPWCTGSRSR